MCMKRLVSLTIPIYGEKITLKKNCEKTNVVKKKKNACGKVSDWVFYTLFYFIDILSAFIQSA